ncbi:DUF742 domain-containing protein [Streptomyces sp. NPDC020731]|uniref:DUF742 domain-containing protein n=1 Tax=Streptomyces sp. NPDC020731 TaxID=3365085 RepID=UPI0037B0537F
MTPPQRQRRFPQDGPPPQSAEPARKEGEGGNPERLYVVAGPDGERADIDLVTLIVAGSPDPPPSATPEQAALLRLCAAPLSVAELSAYLNLPFSVVTVLLTEMLAAELVQARLPIVRKALPDRSLLEAVMHGLQRL